MTKADLVGEMSEKTGISQKAADAALTVLVPGIRDCLQGPDAGMRIPHLGTFKISPRKARTAANPRTGRKFDMPAAQVPSFSAAKSLHSAAKQ